VGCGRLEVRRVRIDEERAAKVCAPVMLHIHMPRFLMLLAIPTYRFVCFAKRGLPNKCASVFVLL
jgi:hypothetical protein